MQIHHCHYASGKGWKRHTDTDAILIYFPSFPIISQVLVGFQSIPVTCCDKIDCKYLIHQISKQLNCSDMLSGQILQIYFWQVLFETLYTPLRFRQHKILGWPRIIIEPLGRRSCLRLYPNKVLIYIFIIYLLVLVFSVRIMPLFVSCRHITHSTSILVPRTGLRNPNEKGRDSPQEVPNMYQLASTKVGVSFHLLP